MQIPTDKNKMLKVCSLVFFCIFQCYISFHLQICRDLHIILKWKTVHRIYKQKAVEKHYCFISVCHDMSQARREKREKGYVLWVWEGTANRFGCPDESRANHSCPPLHHARFTIILNHCCQKSGVGHWMSLEPSNRGKEEKKTASACGMALLVLLHSQNQHFPRVLWEWWDRGPLGKIWFSGLLQTQGINIVSGS